MTTADVRRRLADELPPASANGREVQSNRGARRGHFTAAQLAERRGAWTAAELRELPATVGLEVAGSILGMGLTKARELARTGDFPTRLIRHGDRWWVPTRPLLDLLDVGETPAT